jgi:hypothetical protein
MKRARDAEELEPRTKHWPLHEVLMLCNVILKIQAEFIPLEYRQASSTSNDPESEQMKCIHQRNNRIALKNTSKYRSNSNYIQEIYNLLT